MTLNKDYMFFFFFIAACPDGWKQMSYPYWIQLAVFNNFDYQDDIGSFITGQTQDLDHYNDYPHYCYKRFDELLNFDDAEAKCEEEGATLLQPSWPEELNLVMQAIYQDHHISSTSDDPTYDLYWTGRPSNETRFDPIDPNLAPTRCVAHDFDGWKLGNTPCPIELKFICKRLSIFDEKLTGEGK